MRRDTIRRYAVALSAVLAAALAQPVAAAAALGELVVVVRDAAGPVAGADVMVFDEAGVGVSYADATGADGAAVFADVEDGRYTVFIQVEGLKMWADRAAAHDQATVYEVVDGGRVTVTPTLLPHARIAGVLRDAAGEVGSGELTAHPVGRFGARVTGYILGDGGAAVRVAPGTYRVEFGADGISQWAPGRPSAAGASQFTLAAGDRLDLTEKLPGTGRVRGTVRDADGNPVMGAVVRLHAGRAEAHREKTDREGLFVLPRVRPGAYRASVTSPHGSRQWVPGQPDPDAAAPVTVTAGAETTVDERLSATGDIAGTLYGADGEPTAHGWVFARPVPDTGEELLLSATPDREGRYHLRSLAAGRYLLGFEIDGRRQYLGGKGAASASAPVTVAAGETLRLDERFAAGRPVTLAATGDGGPVAAFCAVLVGPDDERLPDSDQDKYPHGCTRDGRLELPDVLPGRYHARLEPLGPSPFLATTAAVAVGAEPAAASVPLARGGSVTVTAVARPGAGGRRPAVAGATVYLVPRRAGAPTPDPVRTDAAGAATFVGVPPGSYRLYVEPGGTLGRQWVGPHGGVGREDAAASLRVRAGRATAAPPILLDPAGSITGSVTLAATGRPTLAEVAWLPQRFPASGATAHTDAAGWYRAGGFGPYDWPLRFEDGARPSQWSGQQPGSATADTVRVRPGGAVRLDAALAAGVTVGGTLDGAWRTGTVTAVATDGSDVARAAADPLTRRYELPVLPHRTIRLRYELRGPTGTRAGWYRAPGSGTATDVRVPAGGAAIDIGT